MNTSTKKQLKKQIPLAAAILLAVFICIQFIRPAISHPPVKADLQAPPEIKNIITRACYDCHSNQTNLRWFDQIAPAYWLVAGHVRDGRKALNFSDWGKMPAAAQQAKMWEIINQIAAGAMPVPSYTAVHTSAKVSAADLVVLKNYVSGFVKNKTADTAQINATEKQFEKWHRGSVIPTSLPTAANGVTFIPDYKNWQAISTSERFDNGTMRVIFGNDVAVTAIKENNIHPWPNGATFAKADWKQLQDNNGNVRTGEFVQVEFMIKDAQKYAATKGWGWARFKTPKMIPYGGKNALFTTECVNCHRPLKDEDFVFTLPVKQ
ncbi:heme-binding domain-containing protein [Mucilaginibacter sp. X4EP1]|uniref:heme-binding domain-containing protein n=1 Tax=Mucilaginibacter sp. X4EP1 TaxID=2723092 RepID=UPI002166DB33|nr:heme-binding domain-containing protein [Mucilaginibacter sp. X4EP1]MCS3816371.1 mono/diheme cytochrome c family protein [Mucilaginibacter sp. X4EP1]